MNIFLMNRTSAHAWASHDTAGAGFTVRTPRALAAAFVRIALAAGFLSAVADRLGLWGPPGTRNVSWGDLAHFEAYTGRLNPWVPQGLVPALRWTATVAETTFGLALLAGIKIRWSAVGSGLLLLLFASAMALALGIESPLSFSVFAATAAAFLLATLPPDPWTFDHLWNRRRLSHATLALVAVPLCVAFFAAGGCAAPDGGTVAGPGTAALSAAPHPAASVLMTRALPDPPRHEARVVVVEYPPGAASAAHRHPGPVFAYVVEGEVMTALDDGPPVTYRAGQSWYEAPGQIHRVSRNASSTRPAKLVAFLLTEPGDPVKYDAHP